MSASSPSQIQQHFVTQLFASKSNRVRSEEAQPVKREQILRCLAQVDHDIGQVTDTLVKAVTRDPALLESLLRSSNEISAQLKDIFKQSEKLHLQLDGKHGAKQELLHALQKQMELYEEAKLQDDIINTLTALKLIQEKFNAFQSHHRRHEFCAALDILDDVRQIMDTNVLTDDMHIVMRCKDKVNQFKYDLEQALNQAFVQLVSLEHEDHVQLAIRTEYQDLKLSDVISAQYRSGLLRSQLSKLQKQALPLLFEPLLKPTSHQTLYAFESDRATRVLRLNTSTETKTTDSPSNTDSVYKHLTLGIEFMLDKMFGNVPDTYQSECRHLFRQIFYRPLCTAIINDYLRKTIPTRREDLDTFTGILEQSRAFDALFISISNTTFEGGMLSGFADNIKQHYAEKKRISFLDQGRRLLSKYDFTPEIPDHTPKRVYLDENGHLQVNDVTSSTTSPTLSTPLTREPFIFPKCKISRTAMQFGQLFHDALDEACWLKDHSAKHLLLAVRELTSLFQAIVPHQQAKIIEQIPALAMQFHNDCMYLAHQLLILGIDYGDHLPTVVPLAQRDFTDLVPFLRHVGEHYFNLQLEHQKNELLREFEELDGFYEADKPERYEAIQSTIKHTLYTLRKLSDVWQDTLPAHVHQRAVGLLVDAVMERVINDILDLEDISEAESYEINKACQMLLESARLIQPTTDTAMKATDQISDWIPHWNKYKQLLDLLESSMADIMQRVHADQLYMFTADELANIIRALFSASTLRQQNIEEIYSKFGTQDDSLL